MLSEDVQEEIEALEAIFENRYSQCELNRFHVNFENGLRVVVKVPQEYPGCAPDIRVEASDESPLTLTHRQCDELTSRARRIASSVWEDTQDMCLFACIDAIEEALRDTSGLVAVRADVDEPAEMRVTLPEIVQLRKQIIRDRGSRFLTSFCRVTSSEQVPHFVASLKEDKKIAIATHNCVAFRVRNEHGDIEEGRDDDGEQGAGDVMLNLLRQLDVTNFVVCVTRWYGGILLGPTRYKHFKDATLQAIREAGCLDA
ncbi:MAG: hypothetical protein MHM6MM_001528 [Cercozoa sp. M6MM]